jgi:hypothetical protein
MFQLFNHSLVFGKQPGWSTVIFTYDGAYPGLSFQLALVLIAFFGIVAGDSLLRTYRTTGGGPLDGCELHPSEMILVGGFPYFPALLVVLTKLLHSGYVPRYEWPAILGLVLGSVYLVRTIWAKSASTYLLAALLIAFAFQGCMNVLSLYKSSRGLV